MHHSRPAARLPSSEAACSSEIPAMKKNNRKRS